MQCGNGYREKVCWSRPLPDGKFEFVEESLVLLVPLGGVIAAFRVEESADIGIAVGWLATKNWAQYRVIEVTPCSQQKVAVILDRYRPVGSTSGS
jgi:hypothetical protein